MVHDDSTSVLEEMPPALPPIAATATPLSYASGVNYDRVGQSRFAVASFVLCAITVLYCVVCVIGMSRAKGWDGLAWAIFGLLGNWIGCGIAAILALVGVLQRSRGRRLAAHALWVSLTLGIGPIAVIWLVAVV